MGWISAFISLGWVSGGVGGGGWVRFMDSICG